MASFAKLILLSFLCLSTVNYTECVEPVSTALAVGVATSAFTILLEWTGVSNIHCRLGVECCNGIYLTHNITGLNHSLNTRLYGQHLVTSTVVKAIKGHLNNKSPQKALVMSFHGWTGGGKSYVAKMILQNLYKKKEETSFARLFNSAVHFRNANLLQNYKDELFNTIFTKVKKCPYSLFIFDEMDRMDPVLLEVITPFLHHGAMINGVDFRRSIFIFLCNTGGNLINEKMQDIYLVEGRTRESIKLREMQDILEQAAYNQQGGLRRSGLISKNLIDHFVPFLPLNRSHVELCIRDKFKEQKREEPGKEIIDEVLGELRWVPDDTKLFSTSGCKKVEHKISIVLE